MSSAAQIEANRAKLVRQRTKDVCKCGGAFHAHPQIRGFRTVIICDIGMEHLV